MLDARGGGYVAQLVEEHRTGTPPTQLRFPGTARDFSSSQLSIQTLLRCPRVQPHTFTSVRTLKISYSMSDMETLKHQACTVGWVARLCHTWLSPRKATRISMGEIPLGQYSCKM